MGSLSKALGHTNVASTRNAFNRYKKRWGFGNINTKNTSSSAAAIDDGVDPGMVSLFFISLYFLFEGF
jgi:hypothetical protein